MYDSEAFVSCYLTTLRHRNCGVPMETFLNENLESKLDLNFYIYIYI